MAQYRKRPVVVEATVWNKLGDHPNVIQHPDSGEIEGTCTCKFCLKPIRQHGWIQTLEGGFIVCPGDAVITGVEGETYACKPSIFDKTYESVEPGMIDARELIFFKMLDLLRRHLESYNTQLVGDGPANRPNEHALWKTEQYRLIQETRALLKPAAKKPASAWTREPSEVGEYWYWTGMPNERPVTKHVFATAENVLYSHIDGVRTFCLESGGWWAPKPSWPPLPSSEKPA